MATGPLPRHGDDMFYVYRCTTQQLENHLNRIDEAGDTVEHVVFEGGRDWVLICRKDGGRR